MRGAVNKPSSNKSQASEVKNVITQKTDKTSGRPGQHGKTARDRAKQHIMDIRREKFWLSDASHKPSENPLMAMLSRALNQLATGIFERTHHYVFELTQNADDNNYPDHTDRFLKFVLLEDDPTGTPGSRGCLCVLNDETGFEEKHVESLCDIGNSTKQGNREGYIGEKGIGFKSVFLISDRPHIISNGYSFHFRRDDCEAGLGYIVPHWNDLVPAVAENNPTAILLPLQSASGVDVAKQLADIEPECILFLRKLRRIELESASTGLNRRVQCTDMGDGFFNLDADNTSVRYFVHRKEYCCEHIQEERRAGVISTSVTVALPLTSPESTEGRVFAFLPTEVRTGLQFLINADFLLPASRERIFDTPEWNKQLIGFAASTFIEAFDNLRGNANHQTLAYHFIPTKSDLLPGANLFSPLVEAVQTTLKMKECILTETGDFVLPEDAFFAGPLARCLLSKSPPRLGNFQLVHPDLEVHRKQLEPLGVKTLIIPQLLDICSDTKWLSDRDADWWETLFELLFRINVSAESVASFPLLRCQDGVCRSPSERAVFIQPEGQELPLTFQPEWPAAHIFDTELQERVQAKPGVWTWLVRVADLHPFSVQAYIAGSLLDWMYEQVGDYAAPARIVAATHFIAEKLQNPGEHSQTLREKMPWLLADKQILSPEEHADKELVTPECIEGDVGWNLVFVCLADRKHFCLLSDAYFDGQVKTMQSAILKLMKTCGATSIPEPAKLKRTNGMIDWGCPLWLRNLDAQRSPQNLERKIDALERWIGWFELERFAKFLTLTDECPWIGNADTQPSELGNALRNRPWLRTTKGMVSPPAAFVNDPEIHEFLGDSVPYSQSKLANELLGKLGICLRLSVEALVKILRQIRVNGPPIDEPLVLRIYQRLQTVKFDGELFQQEALIYLAEPSATWREKEYVFWNDAGDVFDEYFGYAKLTYENDDLHTFFTDKLGVRDEVPEQKLAEVWVQMSGEAVLPLDVVEKRLSMILQRLANVVSTKESPDWWVKFKPCLKVWTTAKCFHEPAEVYAPDDTSAEKIFSASARIAWKPKGLSSAKLNLLLEGLGCRSLARSLRNRAVKPVVMQNNGGEPKFLTSASKELLLCWVCAADEWSNKQQQLKQLLRTEEVQIVELHVEYWLDGDGKTISSVESDSYWSRQDHRLYLRYDATLKAQQSATATSIAEQFGRRGNQDDTVYRLLGLEAPDALRELAKQKWELTTKQKAWLQSIGYTSVFVDISAEAPNQNVRAPRPALKTQPSGTFGSTTPKQQSAPDAHVEYQTTSDLQSEPPPSDFSGPESGKTRTPEPGLADQQSRPQENMDESSRALKSPDAETEFVHVTAHTRNRSRRERRPRKTAGGPGQERHPMASISQATKTEIEEAAVHVILQQFATRPDLILFSKPIDRRKENKGYDIYTAKPGQVLRIEIKAHLRESKSVFLTQKEWQASRHSTPENRWELWNVENLASEAGHVRVTRYSHIPRDALRESGYWIDLNACHSKWNQ